MKCETNWALSSLKVLMELGVNMLNHILARPFSVVGKALHMFSLSTPWRCIRVLKDSKWSRGLCFRHSFPPATYETLVEGGRSWRMWWMVSRFGGPDHQGCWTLVLLGRSSWRPSIPSSPVSPWQCGVDLYQWRMDDSYLVALVCLGHYYLLALLGLFTRHWYLLGPLAKCRDPHPSGVTVLLGLDSVWWGVPLLLWGLDLPL